MLITLDEMACFFEFRFKNLVGTRYKRSCFGNYLYNCFLHLFPNFNCNFSCGYNTYLGFWGFLDLCECIYATTFSLRLNTKIIYWGTYYWDYVVSWYIVLFGGTKLINYFLFLLKVIYFFFIFCQY